MNTVYNVVKNWCNTHSNGLTLSRDGGRKLLVGGEMWDNLLDTLTKSGFDNYVNDTEFTGDELLGILYDFNVEIWYGGEDE